MPGGGARREHVAGRVGGGHGGDVGVGRRAHPVAHDEHGTAARIGQRDRVLVPRMMPALVAHRGERAARSSPRGGRVRSVRVGRTGRTSRRRRTFRRTRSAGAPDRRWPQSVARRLGPGPAPGSPLPSPVARPTAAPSQVRGRAQRPRRTLRRTGRRPRRSPPHARAACHCSGPRPDLVRGIDQPDPLVARSRSATPAAGTPTRPPSRKPMLGGRHPAIRIVGWSPRGEPPRCASSSALHDVGLPVAARRARPRRCSRCASARSDEAATAVADSSVGRAQRAATYDARRRSRRDRARPELPACRRAAARPGPARTRPAQRTRRRPSCTSRTAARRRRRRRRPSHASASASFGASSPGTWPTTVLNAVVARVRSRRRTTRASPDIHTARHSQGLSASVRRRPGGRRRGRRLR